MKLLIRIEEWIEGRLFARKFMRMCKARQNELYSLWKETAFLHNGLGTKLIGVDFAREKVK